MKKKKIVRIIVCCAVSLLLAGGAVTWAFLPHPLDYPIRSITPAGCSSAVTSQTEDSVTVQAGHGGDFRIILFTDLHLDGKNKTSRETVRRLVENIQSEKPDLVLLGGDNVTSGMNRLRCRQPAEIFEKLGEQTKNS